MNDEDEATRLADALDAYGETTQAESNLRAKVSALLRRWPDGEPVAWRWQSPIGGWAYGEAVNPHAIPGGFAVQPLYTAPPAERIAALEAALEQARVALGEIEYSNDSRWQSDRATEALRAIEGVQR